MFGSQHIPREIFQWCHYVKKALGVSFWCLSLLWRYEQSVLINHLNWSFLLSRLYWEDNSMQMKWLSKDMLTRCGFCSNRNMHWTTDFRLLTHRNFPLGTYTRVARIIHFSISFFIPEWPCLWNVSPVCRVKTGMKQQICFYISWMRWVFCSYRICAKLSSFLCIWVSGKLWRRCSDGCDSIELAFRLGNTVNRCSLVKNADLSWLGSKSKIGDNYRVHY